MSPAPLSAAENKSEQPGYFEVQGDHLFTVLHPVTSPRARVLLLGPFAPERNQAYLPWVRWARYLHARNIEVLRFDYRGVGESTGRFEAQTFAEWMQDASQLGSWLGRRTPRVPMLLHGLTLGAIIAGRCFDEGIGDGLMLWSPPATANVVLHSALKKWVTLQKLSVRSELRKPFSAYLEQLESGATLEVNGYLWSSQLWRDSLEFRMPSALADHISAAAVYHRPIHFLELGREATPLVHGGLPGYEESNDLTWLYASQFDWIVSAIRLLRGTPYEEGDHDPSARHA